MRLFIFLLMIPFSGFGQGILRGVVIDGTTQQPFDGANVFVSNSTYKTITDPNGNFALQVPDGSYEVVVSFVGYEPIAVQSSAFADLTKKYTLALLPETEQLRPVSILSAKARARYLQQFKEAFIGTSKNAQLTRIVNLDDVNIELDENAHFLEVSAFEPLIIENPELNYRLTFVLAGFRLDLKSGISNYSGYPSFDDLEPITEKNSKRINKNRQRAYEGSVMHFIRTLYNGEDLTHDFSVEAFELQPTLSSATSLHANNQEGKPVFMKRNLSASDFIIEVSGRKYLQFSDYLRVAYKNERPERMYSHRYNSHDRDQVSQIRSDAPRIEIFANGNYADSNALILFGYMGWEKLADMVPLTYIPVED